MDNLIGKLFGPKDLVGPQKEAAKGFLSNATIYIEPVYREILDRLRVGEPVSNEERDRARAYMTDKNEVFRRILGY